MKFTINRLTWDCIPKRAWEHCHPTVSPTDFDRNQGFVDLYLQIALSFTHPSSCQQGIRNGNSSCSSFWWPRSIAWGQRSVAPPTETCPQVLCVIVGARPARVGCGSGTGNRYLHKIYNPEERKRSWNTPCSIFTFHSLHYWKSLETRKWLHFKAERDNRSLRQHTISDRHFQNLYES